MNWRYKERLGASSSLRLDWLGWSCHWEHNLAEVFGGNSWARGAVFPHDFVVKLRPLINRLSPGYSFHPARPRTILALHTPIVALRTRVPHGHSFVSWVIDRATSASNTVILGLAHLKSACWSIPALCLRSASRVAAPISMAKNDLLQSHDWQQASNLSMISSFPFTYGILRCGATKKYYSNNIIKTARVNIK